MFRNRTLLALGLGLLLGIAASGGYRTSVIAAPAEDQEQALGGLVPARVVAHQVHRDDPPLRAGLHTDEVAGQHHVDRSLGGLASQQRQLLNQLINQSINYSINRSPS